MADFVNSNTCIFVYINRVIWWSLHKFDGNKLPNHNILLFYQYHLYYRMTNVKTKTNMVCRSLSGQMKCVRKLKLQRYDFTCHATNICKWRALTEDEASCKSLHKETLPKMQTNTWLYRPEASTSIRQRKLPIVVKTKPYLQAWVGSRSRDTVRRLHCLHWKKRLVPFVLVNLCWASQQLLWRLAALYLHCEEWRTITNQDRVTLSSVLSAYFHRHQIYKHTMIMIRNKYIFVFKEIDLKQIFQLDQ